MRIGIVGLGAVGGFLAARLAAGGHQVSALARGATLEHVRLDGLALLEGPQDRPREMRLRVQASDDAADLGEQDLVVLSVKTTGLAEVAPRIGPMPGPDTAVLSAMNGVPWWFFHGLDEALARREWEAIDAGGRIAAAIPAQRVL